MSLIFVALYLLKFGIYPWTKGPPEELWNPAPYGKGPRRSLIYQCIRYRQTDPGKGCGTSRSLWTDSKPSWLQHLENTEWAYTHRWERLNRNSGFSRSSSTPLEQKIYTSLDASEWIRGTLPVSPLPTRQHSLEKEEVEGPSCGGKGRVVSQHPNSPAVAAAKETHFCPTAPRLLKQELHYLGKEGFRKQAGKNIRKH